MTSNSKTVFRQKSPNQQPFCKLIIFVVAEIFPGNGLLTSKSETVYFLNSAIEQ